jgi:2-polyprenyl-3-methyl-5-hydroxy-6-metoxy-1,4-benzoquinol methylase
MTGTHDWEKYISPMDMSRMLAANHFKDAEFSGIVVAGCGGSGQGIGSGIQWKLDDKDLSVNYILKAVAY